MKTLQIIFLCSLLLAGLSSCSKENEEGVYDPVNAMYETYTGMQGEGVEEPARFLQLKLEDNGSLFAFNGRKEMAGAGKWEIKGTSFNGQFRQRNNNMIMHLSGVYNASENKISGTWGYGEFTMGGGSFFIAKDDRKIAVIKKKSSSPAGSFIDRFF